jgi:hypothetical protein
MGSNVFNLTGDSVPYAKLLLTIMSCVAHATANIELISTFALQYVTQNTVRGVIRIFKTASKVPVVYL